MKRNGTIMTTVLSYEGCIFIREFNVVGVFIKQDLISMILQLFNA